MTNSYKAIAMRPYPTIAKLRVIARFQRGVATLPISLILLILLTLITLYAARVGVIETRSSANKVRYDEAFQAAEAGVEQGITYIQMNRNAVHNGTWAWATCSGVTTIPCSEIPSADRAKWLYVSNIANTTQPSNGSYVLHFLTPCKDMNFDGTCDSAEPYDYPPINMVAVGTSADQSGSATVRQTMTFYEIGGGNAGAPVPLVAPANVPLSGNYSIVTNPNGGGRGVPLSVWTDSNVDLAGGSMISCHTEEFLQSGSPNNQDIADNASTGNSGLTMCSACTCDAGTTGTLSKSGASPIKNYDILDNDTNFPDDIFQMITGVPAENYNDFRQTIQMMGPGRDLPDCSSLGTSSEGWYWIEGDCTLTKVGNLASHGVKVIVNGDLTMNAGGYVFGMVFVFTPFTSGACPVTPVRDLKSNGGFVLYGSLITNCEIDDFLLNGNFVLRYVDELFANVPGDLGDSGFGKLPNSWSDF